MSQPQRWWIGLLFLIPLWIFANWIETPNVETDLSARAGRASATASKMITGSSATAQGRDITLTGRALSGDAPEAARQAALGERGVRLVNSAIAPADAPKPYPFTAGLANGALTLGGYAPSPDVRAKILSAARTISGVKVADNMQLGAGAPAGFEAMAGHGLAQLGKLGNGQFSLADAIWSLTGQAPNSAIYGEVTAAAGSLPSGAKPGKISITAPLAKPYAFSVGRNGDAVTMAGVVPSVAARGEIAAAIAKALPTAKIADSTALASGEPSGFAAMAAHGAGLAARLVDGKFSLSDAAYSLSGRAPTASAFDELTKLAGALPQGATRGQIDITAPLAKPYAFNVGRNGDAVTMAGVVPSVAARGEIAAAIAKALPTAKIADSTTLASGEPSGFAAMAAHGAGLAARLIDGKFSLTDAVYSLSGRAPTATAHGELTKLAGALPQGATRGQIDIGLPVAGRYLLEAVRTPAGMTVSGNVPSVEVRDAILAAARKAIAPGLVTDATTLADGAPQGFVAIASHGAALAGQLIDGKFSLAANSYSLSGRAPSTGAYAGLLAASQALPAGAQAGAVSVLPAIASPYAFSARQGNDGRVVLGGFVPNQGQRAALVAAAQKWFPDAVDDRLEIAAGEPSGFEGVAAAGIGMMARLQNGAWSLANGKWSLAGDAPSQDTANGVLAALRKSLGAAIDFDGSGVKAPPPPPPPPPVVAPPPPPPAPAPVVQAPVAPPPAPKPVAPPVDPCARGADGVIARAVIRFDTADRSLTPDDRAALEKLIGVLKACASARLEIEGHTDNQGARERNIPLSSRRAFSTSRFFTGAGVSRERITTRGYGEDRPMADNATPEGRAQNRRVEVLVK